MRERSERIVKDSAPTPDPDGGRGPYGPEFLTELFRLPLDPGYADAAARREEVGPRSGWRRETVRVASAVTALAIGFLLVVAYRQTVAEEPERSRARAGLVSQVNERRDITDDLQRRADVLRAEVARQRDAALDNDRVAELRGLEMATGLTKVRGDGVVVRVGDSPDANDPEATTEAAEYGRVLDRDLQDIANALWGAGAEAIAINGQRLTSTTTIRRAGRAILVDFRPVSGPYEVSAVGPKDLDRRFDSSGQAAVLRELVRKYGMSYEVREVEDLTLAAATEPNMRYAQPLNPPSPPPGSTPQTRPTQTSPTRTPSTSPSGGG